MNLSVCNSLLYWIVCLGQGSQHCLSVTQCIVMLFEVSLANGTPCLNEITCINKGYNDNNN